ncbi:MAG: hypothetical protein J6J24_04035 [Clostridia bacterium]|nr:hypothetical protein [Clostridia bacterium]
MKFAKKKGYKICPRCGEKCLIGQERCNECNLIFSRLQYASNKAAKKKLRKFDNDFIVYTSTFPSDLKYWKLLLLTIFTGLFGGHYYYCGKYIKGGLMTASFIYTLFCTIFNQVIVEQIPGGESMYVLVGIATFSWIVSLCFLLCKKFKVPVIVDMPKSEVVE